MVGVAVFVTGGGVACGRRGVMLVSLNEHNSWMYLLLRCQSRVT